MPGMMRLVLCFIIGGMRGCVSWILGLIRGMWSVGFGAGAVFGGSGCCGWWIGGISAGVLFVVAIIIVLWTVIVIFILV